MDLEDWGVSSRKYELWGTSSSVRLGENFGKEVKATFVDPAQKVEVLSLGFVLFVFE
jgi:hypothetical protein